MVLTLLQFKSRAFPAKAFGMPNPPLFSSIPLNGLLIQLEHTISLVRVFITQPSADGQSGCLRVLAPITSMLVSMDEHPSLPEDTEAVRYIPKGLDMGRSQGDFISSFLM